VIYSPYIHTKRDPKSAGALGALFIFSLSVILDKGSNISHIIIPFRSEFLIERRGKSLIWEKDFEKSIFFDEIVYEDFEIPITRNEKNLAELLTFIDDFCENMEYEITINISFFCRLHFVYLMLEYDNISEFLESSIELYIIILDIAEKIINA
jgi:hypothetical protein